MMVINNPATGAPEEKPGFFANQIHSSEVIAAASGQYTIWYLLSRYGEDEEVTRIVDNLSLYLVPRLDMDGAEADLDGMLGNMMDSNIGQIAKEVAETMDIESMFGSIDENSNPMELMSHLMNPEKMGGTAAI